VFDNPYAGLVGRLAKVPVHLGSLRGSTNLPGFQSLHPLNRWLSLHSVSKLSVNSEAISKELRIKEYPQDRIVVLPNCVENSSRDQAMPDLSSSGVQDHHRVVGTVGNLRSVKNHLMFLEGLAKVLPHFSDVRGLIAGQPIPDEPDLPGKIALRIKELNLNGNVILAGFRSDVPALMHRLSVFCLTSTHEGMPNVILEAMAAARPVVATNVGGIPELVKDGVNGFLVEPGDIEGFAHAVKRLLEDSKLAERMGLAGRKRVEQEFSCDQAAQRLTKLYLDTLDQKGIMVA
jgi:glycosyltransferase involved in cell wall biosynthesis